MAAAISKITIDGFKAFPDSFTLNLEDGKNLLIYGENGSGKSSIYYALHSLLQSQCKDKNSTYFDPNNAESLVNQHTKKPDAKVTVQLNGSDVTYSISRAGYHESVTHPISPLKEMNGQCVFINHKFLFNVFSFRNSQYIDLFPVFIKDILPFTLTSDKSKYISELYAKIMEGVKKKGNSNYLDPDYVGSIKTFNDELKLIINKINTTNIPNASQLYNNYFRNADDPELQITLVYDEHKDDIPQPNRSCWLRIGYRFQNDIVAGAPKKVRYSKIQEILQPVITLKVDEKQTDGTFANIKKPQTYFNEAKLTAIALSIRFALLDTITASNGRFLALDDMLISLDMSNRMKVVDYLLNVVSDKYKIYLFTHDRLFYSTLKKRIAIEKMQGDWIYGGLYMHDVDENNDYKPCIPYPRFIIDKNKPLDIMEYYAKHDYPACGQKMRKWCEELLNKLYPDTLKKRVEATTGNTVETSLNDKIDSLGYYCNKETIDYTLLKNLKIYKDNVLNAVSHYDIESPLYKEEILCILKVLNELQKLVTNIKEIVIHKDLGIDLTKPDGVPVTICFSIKGTTKLPLLYIRGDYRISYFVKCSVKKLIISGVDNVLPDEESFDSIYDVYEKYCTKYGLPNTDNLLDITKDRGTKLRDKI